MFDTRYRVAVSTRFAYADGSKSEPVVRVVETAQDFEEGIDFGRREACWALECRTSSHAAGTSMTTTVSMDASAEWTITSTASEEIGLAASEDVVTVSPIDICVLCGVDAESHGEGH